MLLFFVGFYLKYVLLSRCLIGVALAYESTKHYYYYYWFYRFLRNTWLTHLVIGWCLIFPLTENSTLLSCICVCFLHWWIWKYLQSSERAGGCLSHAAVCHPSDTLPLAHTDTLRGRLAQWYVYWEALDNRKGGGCCRNVTTIDNGAKKKKKKKRKTDMKSLFQTLTHKQSLTRVHNHVLQKQDKTYSNAQDETVITVSTKLDSTWKKKQITVTLMMEVFFSIGTAKSNEIFIFSLTTTR